MTDQRERIERELARLRFEWRKHPSSRHSIETMARRLAAKLEDLNRAAGAEETHRTTEEEPV